MPNGHDEPPHAYAQVISSLIDGTAEPQQRDSPLSSANVNRVFNACLAEGEDVVVKVDGVVHTAEFSKAELDQHAQLIGAMLDQLPDGFKTREKGGGDGWSFLNACDDRDGNQWTGLHLIMEQLFMLGIATEQARWCIERDKWEMLPQGMPYVVVEPRP